MGEEIIIYKKIKKTIFAHNVFLFFLSLVVVTTLFYDGKIILAVDSNYPLFPLERAMDWIYSWHNSSSNLGSSNTFPRTTIFPYLILLIPFEYYKVSPFYGEFFIVFLFFFISGTGLYKLSMELFKLRPIIALVSSLLYMFNPINEFLFEAFIPEAMFGYLAFPWITFFFIKGVRSRKNLFKNSIYLNLVFLMFLPTNANPPLLGIVLLTQTFFIIYQLFIEKNNRVFNFRFVAVSCITFVLLNLWIYLPIFQFRKEYQDATLAVRDFVLSLNSNSTYSSFLNILRLLPSTGWHDIYWGSKVAFPITTFYKLNPIGIILSFAYPVLIAIPLLINKYKPRNDRLFFSLMVFCFIFSFFTKGSHNPLGAVYVWFFEHVPFFSMYRSPTQKFTWALVLAYSLLIGYSLHYLRVSLCRKIRCGRYIYLGILTLLLLYQWPWFTGDIVPRGDGAMTSYHVKIPENYYEARKWSLSQKDDFRFISLPSIGRNYLWGQYDWGYMGVDFTAEMLGRNVVDIGINGGLTSQDIRDITYVSLGETVNMPANYRYIAINSIEPSRFLRLINVKYLLLHRDRICNHMHYKATHYKTFENRFSQISGIKYDCSYGKLDFYKLDDKNFLPHIYATSN